jgi:hypothetical protein
MPGEKPLLTRQSHARHSFRVSGPTTFSGSTTLPDRRRRRRAQFIARNARYSALSRAPPPSSGRANRLPQAMCQFCDKRDRENSSFCVLPIFIVDEDHDARERCCMTIGRMESANGLREVQSGLPQYTETMIRALGENANRERAAARKPRPQRCIVRTCPFLHSIVTQLAQIQSPSEQNEGKS